MPGSSPSDILSWENLIYLADFFEDFRERKISLLGGEPTLHPEFTNFVMYLLERGFGITVFTSGIMTDEVLECIVASFAKVPPDKLSFVCNLNDPQDSPLTEVHRVKRFLELFGSHVCAGFNIYRPDFKLDFLLHYISQYGLKRFIRLGMAHPIPGQKNLFIKVEDMQNVVDRLMLYAPVFERLRVSMGPDCGFPMCCFTEAQLGCMYKMTGGMFRFGCGPAIDIGPDMNVWSCFPLSSYHKRSVFEFDSLGDIYRFYEERLRNIRIEMGGIFEACDDCKYREEGICTGGCAAQLLSVFKDEAPVCIPEIYS